MVEWLGIGIAFVAAYFAWRANHKSDDANEIARRALALSESEYEDRRRDREARARLDVTADVEGREPDENGIIRLGGSAGNLQLAITVRNKGDRNAGRAMVNVTLPLSMSGSSVRWADPSGRELSEFSQRAGRVDDVNLITRELDGIAVDVPEQLWLCARRSLLPTPNITLTLFGAENVRSNPATRTALDVARNGDSS